MHPEYYEGVLQLRDAGEDVIEFVRFLFSQREDAVISKEIYLSNGGIDFYVTSQKYLRSISSKLQDKYGGELVHSRRIHTTDRYSGHDLYRAYVLFKPCKYKKDQIIEFKGDQIKVITAKKELFGHNMTTNKKVHIKFSLLN
jgi:NMD protein affecting ribosome stability and mRNA decay